MMNCPSCSAELRKTLGEDRKPKYYCTECDWGSVNRQRLVEISRANRTDPKSWAAVEPARGWRLAGLWVASLAMAIVPYVVVLSLEEGYLDSAFVDLFERIYWPAIGGYVLVCALWNEVFLDRLARWWEKGDFWIQDWFFDPDSLIEYYGSHPGVVLFPGKVIVYTLYSTVRLVV